MLSRKTRRPGVHLALVMLGVFTLVALTVALQVKTPVRTSNETKRSSGAREIATRTQRTGLKTDRPPIAPPVPETLALERFARQVEGVLAKDLRAQLEGNVKHQEYQRCLESGDSEQHCPSLYADATYLAMSEAGTHAAAIALREELDALPVFDHAKARAAIAELAEKSSDDMARVAALKVLSLEIETEQPPLSEATYANLSAKPIVESLLLARRHVTVPPTTARIAGEFAVLADSPDARVRSWALRALGHEETASELNAALSNAAPSGAQTRPAALAAMGCGLKCLESVEYLMQGDGAARAAVYDALSLVPEHERAEIARVISSFAPRDSAESAARAEVFLNADVQL